MVSLSRKADYALLCLAHLAEQGCQARPCVSARCLADVYGLPRSFVANLLKQLHRAGLIASTRGASGGYVLAREPESLTLAAILRAVEDGPVQLARCCRAEQGSECCQEQGAQAGGCEIAGSCPVREGIQALNAHVGTLFERVSLRDLLERRVQRVLGEAADASGSDLPILR